VMAQMRGYDALRDHAGTLSGPHLSAFGHAFSRAERSHLRREQGQELVKHVLLQKEEGRAAAAVDGVHYRQLVEKHQARRSGTV
jgi:hypothetical protein